MAPDQIAGPNSGDSWDPQCHRTTVSGQQTQRRTTFDVASKSDRIDWRFRLRGGIKILAQHRQPEAEGRPLSKLRLGRDLAAAASTISFTMEVYGRCRFANGLGVVGAEELERRAAPSPPGGCRCRCRSRWRPADRPPAAATHLTRPPSRLYLMALLTKLFQRLLI